MLRSMKASIQADVAVVMTDAIGGLHGPGRPRGRTCAGGGQGHRAGHQQVGCGREGRLHRRRGSKVLRREAPYLAWADIVFASAQTGQRVERILREARRVAEERYRRVPTADLNRVVTDAVRAHPPAHVRNRLGKAVMRHPGGRGPADIRDLRQRPGADPLQLSPLPREPDSREYGFLGTPIRLIFRKRASEEAARRSARPRRSSSIRGRAKQRVGSAEHLLRREPHAP